VVGLTLTVAYVSGAMQSRAAVFTMSPQAVEVFQQGVWWPGSLLGWRHDGGGACQMWVRVEIGGTSETAWTDLSTLRLPETGGSPLAAWSGRAAGMPLPAAPGGASSTDGVAGLRGQASEAVVADDPAPTQHLPLVRDAAPRRNGGLAAGSGRRRAPESEESARPVQSGPADPAALAGRHRAPAPTEISVQPGRHRAADTSVLPSVRPVASDWAASAAAGDWAPPPPRSELPPAGPVVRPRSARPAGGDLLTRPMRLDEAVGSGRPARRRDSVRV
jgi:hypothetical protein